MCTPGGGGVQTLLKESGPLETGTQSTVRDKFDALGVHCLLFFLLLAMHLAGIVKSSALLTGGIRSVVIC